MGGMSVDNIMRVTMATLFRWDSERYDTTPIKHGMITEDADGSVTIDGVRIKPWDLQKDTGTTR
jgi:hypothetical protein